MGGYWFSARHSVNMVAKGDTASKVAASASQVVASAPQIDPALALPFAAGEVASISAVSQDAKSNRVLVSYNQVEPKTVSGTLENPQIRQLLMLASQNGTSPAVRDNSVDLLAAECRTGNGCMGTSPQSTSIKDALMVALRYDRSTAVRQKALSGLQPFVGEDMQVRNAVLETLMNDPDAHLRSAAISMLQPVEADTSVRQVLSTVALSDQNPTIRNASRVVLRRVSEIQ